MLEDSITSSPSKSNKSIRETRLKRKIKRKHNADNEPNKSDHKIPADLHSFINDFYLDSEDESTDNTTFLVGKTTAIVNNYKPFELEKSLAIADRLSAQQLQRNKTNFMPETEGFVSCINLTQIELEKCTRGNLNQRISSFGISESEMINCCNLAEQNLQLTPKKDEMFLVNSILEDFSQSPLNKQVNKPQSPCQHTPEFRLQRKPIKTYSRTFLNHTKRNLNERFVVSDHISSSDDDNDDRSSTSSLSIQEDVTMTEVANNQSAVASLHNTRLCENLLNLSVYFTQNQSQENIELTGLSSDREDHIFCSNVAYLIKDILTLRSIYQHTECCDSFSSADDFLGFPCHRTVSVNGNIDVDSTDHNSVHTTLNITQDLSIHNDRQLDMSVNGEDWNDEDCEDIFACINTENILNQQNFQQSNAVENYNEFVLPLHPVDNKNTQIQNEIPVNKIGFTTASSKPITVSREAHIMAAKILSNLPEIPSLENDENVKNCDNKSLKDNNIFENLEDDEWNDDCDLLLNLQTPIVNTSEKLTTNTKRQDSKLEIDTITKMPSLGFQTAGGKNVVISRKAQESVENLLREFDIDVEDNFNCEEALKEMKCKVYANNHNLETKKANAKESVKNEEFHQEECASTSKKISLGFQTAGGKNVHISRKAQETVQNLLKEFDNVEENYNCEEELKEMKSNVYKKTHKLPTLQSCSKVSNDIKLQFPEQETTNNLSIISIGFKTAGGKNVNVTKKAQESVRKLLKEFSNDVEDYQNCEDKLKEMKNKVYAKTHNVETNQIENNGRETITSNAITKNESKYHQLEFDGPSTSKMALEGFKTAGGKNVNISKKAQESVQKLFEEFSNDFENNFNCEENLMKTKNNVYNKTHNLETISKEENTTSRGFQTAKGSKIVTSAKAQKSVANILKDFVDDTNTNYLNDLELAKNEIYNKNNKLKEKIMETNKPNEDLSNIMLSEWPLEEFPESQTKLIAKNDIQTLNDTNRENFIDDSDTNKGFQTNKGQQIPVSTKAQQMVNNLLQEFETDDMEMEKYENDLINMKTKIQNRKELKLKSSQEPKEFNLTPKTIKSKRKYSLDNSVTNTSPPAKLQNTGLFNSKSSLVEHSLQSPLTLASPAVIGRKNLSLTKKLKNKRSLMQTTTAHELMNINKEEIKLNHEILTPIKSSIHKKINQDTPNTPNLKEFFSDANLTSTPRLNQAITSSKQIIDEQDFKPINWKNNDSVSNQSTNNHTTKLSDNSAMNISINSSNPTAKERIGRLKIYGKAPPVSPILIETHHNCRPSGLRRTRSSMLKKKEN